MLHLSMILIIAQNLQIIQPHFQVKEKGVHAILLDVYVEEVDFLLHPKMNVQKAVAQNITKIGNIVKFFYLIIFAYKYRLEKGVNEVDFFCFLYLITFKSSTQYSSTYT